ncbi:MAG: aminotransferase class III-fold pyridoxal phosphate-dependent enzyme [Synergistaceae bacterium]|nr:aminotransferase class III-fold pyridoxal phosphate-dependent enzyme [Synergistaceae bacterium]
MSDSLSSLYGGRGIAFTHGRGSHIFDTAGREYIDFFNGHGASLFGHSHPLLTETLEKAAKGIWTSGAGFESPIREKLADELGMMFGGGRAFFCNSGTEAVEAALKLSLILRKGRSRILACRRGFHGRSCGALSMTFNPKYREPFMPLLGKVEHFSISELAENIDDDTAAVFIEPVQGEGGVHPLPSETGNKITKACQKHSALLICDEIQSGLGRCGAPLASSITGLDPDMVCLAKGLAGGIPAGALVWKKELGDFLPHSHGSTYGGNELAAAVSLTVLSMVMHSGLPEKATRSGEFFRSRIAAIGSSHIKDVRGLGLLNGIELDIPSVGVVRALQENGLLSLTAGPRTLRFLPSFAAEGKDFEDAALILTRTLEGF